MATVTERGISHCVIRQAGSVGLATQGSMVVVLVVQLSQHSAGVQAAPEQRGGLAIAVVPAAHTSAPPVAVTQAGPAFAAQVTTFKVVVPAGHAAVAALAVNPDIHVTVQAAALGILVTPVPHGSAPLVPIALLTAITAQPLSQHSAGVQAAPEQRGGLAIAVVPAAHTSAPPVAVTQAGPVFAAQVTTFKVVVPH